MEGVRMDSLHGSIGIKRVHPTRHREAKTSQRRYPPAVVPVLLVTVSLALWSGCSLRQPLHEQRIGALGSFEFREPDIGMEGVLIGAPHAGAEPDAKDFAVWISNRTGAGLAIADGFKSKRLTVAQPLVRSGPYLTLSDDPIKRGSVYSEFKRVLKAAANGNIEFYVGVRVAGKEAKIDRIEVATSGFTFEEIAVLETAFSSARDHALEGRSIPKLEIALDPLDKISWRAAAVKHHGVLMIAKKGLDLRLPPAWATPSVKAFYEEILGPWIIEAMNHARANRSPLPRMQVQLMNYGRIESTPSRKNIKGVVIGAPHGTFDEYTAEMVNHISYETGIAAVIAKGFTPTECQGWRINVNRPTENRYPDGTLEIPSERAKAVYESYKKTVFEAAQKELKLYIDVHQNGRRDQIEVATVGISRSQALAIKTIYNAIRDRHLRQSPGVEAVELAIEPVDPIEIGAWAAKVTGILSVARKSLHFELPAQRILWKPKMRNVYTEVLAEVFRQASDLILSPPKPATLVHRAGLQTLSLSYPIF